jgi:tetratricopeptide (TPR) repeat protein
VVASLLKDCPLLLLFDDFEQNLTPGGDDFLDPAAGEVITALSDAAETGALLVTCRYRLPGPDRFLAEIPVPALSPAELRRMFLRLPALADLDPVDQRLLIRAIGGHPRLIEFTDALLRGGRSSRRHVQARLRDLATEHNIDLRASRPVTQAVDQAMILGSADILLNELLSLLTPRQAAVLAQVALSPAPMTRDDLAFTFTAGPDSAGTEYPGAGALPSAAELRADATRLADLTLLAPGEDITMHPWTAALVSRNTAASPDRLAALHERALAMRLRRFEQRRGTYDDLLDIPRHLAALGRYDDISDIARRATRMLPGTLATAAYLAEICPLIPLDQRAWILVAELDVQALLNAGNLPAATRELEAIHQQAQARAVADPGNTQWQRDLSVIHDKLGDIAAAAGDLTAARDHHQASLDIATRLAAADPANTQWQRDLAVSHNFLGNVAITAGDVPTARSHYQAYLDISTRLTAADPANTQWQRDLSVSHNKLGDAAAAAGDLTAARDHHQASLDIATRLAAADPANTEWQRDLVYVRRRIAALGVSPQPLEG